MSGRMRSRCCGGCGFCGRPEWNGTGLARAMWAVRQYEVGAERLRGTPDEAFVLLRRYARDHNYPLTELAGDVIRGTASVVPGA